MHDWNSYTMPLNLSLSCNGQTKNHSITIFQRKDIINQSPEIIDSIKIDLSCFTQGLLKVDNFFYFSCGQYDKSKLYALDIDNRRITKETKVDPSYFLEGIDLYDDSIIALTWKEHKMLFFSKDLVFSHAIDIPLSIKEGWGVFTVDGKIYISDGTSILHEFVVENSMLKQNRKLRIHQNGQELKFINEMAYVSDSTFAFNRWYDHRIYFANRHSGAVYKVLDFSKTAKNYRLRGVLNGVHIEKDMVYFTGKNWPWLFVGRFSYQ
jgi:glutamine cyclotransferase